MGKVVIQKNRSRLEFIFEECGRSVLYDFKDDSFISHTGKNIKLSTVKSIFSKFGHRIDGDKSNPLYTKLFQTIEKNSNLKNLGSKLDKLKYYKYTEKWLLQGFVINCIIDEYMDMSYTKVNKLVKNVYIKTNTNINLMDVFSDSDKIGVVLDEISKRYDSEYVRKFLESYRIRTWSCKVKQLLSEYNYNSKSLANYICDIVDYEGLDIYVTVDYLIDYLTMNKQMGVNKPEKYPRYLHTCHDIVVRNFNAFKIKYNDDIFYNIRREDLEYTGKKYSIIYPKHYTDIQKEGAQLNHCVASYVDMVIKGKTHILFLRKNDNLDESLVTVEIRNNTICQYKGAYNRILSTEEMEFLKIYSNKKSIPII